MDLVKTVLVLASVPFFLLYLSILLVYVGFRRGWLTLRLIAFLSALVVLCTITWIGYFSGLSFSSAILFGLGVAIIQTASFLLGSLLFPNIWKKIEIPF